MKCVNETADPLPWPQRIFVLFRSFTLSSLGLRHMYLTKSGDTNPAWGSSRACQASRPLIQTLNASPSRGHPEQCIPPPAVWGSPQNAFHSLSAIKLFLVSQHLNPYVLSGFEWPEWFKNYILFRRDTENAFSFCLNLYKWRNFIQNCLKKILNDKMVIYSEFQPNLSKILCANFHKYWITIVSTDQNETYWIFLKKK